MIGQADNRQLIEKWVKCDTLPRFIIITGDVGSGRKTLARYIANRFDTISINSGLAIDDVRTTISTVSKTAGRTISIFADADTMSVDAKNALLKVTEEPPLEAYFIMTVRDVQALPYTIVSRAVVLKMNPYTRSELENFTTDADILDVANTPGMCMSIDNAMAMRLKEFADNLSASVFCRAPGSVILSSTELLKNKSTDEDKLDCSLSWSALKKYLFKKTKLYSIDLSMVSCVAESVNQCNLLMSRKGTNQKNAIEELCLKLRAIYRGEQKDESGRVNAVLQK